MDTAIVTGASSGIGHSIAKTLLKLGYRVYGLGRDFSKIKDDDIYNNESFIPITCDLMKTSLLCEKIKEISKSESVKILVNNAGAGYFGPHEELNPSKIHEMVTVNLEVPLILSQLLLRQLKKNEGYIINISSIEAKKSSVYGCVYGATKAGLTHFSESLFDESRKYGVKVITIHPDMTQTNFYRHSNFKEAEESDTYITPDEVSSAVEMVLTQRNGLVCTDITLRPQKHKIKRI